MSKLFSENTSSDSKFVGATSAAVGFELKKAKSLSDFFAKNKAKMLARDLSNYLNELVAKKKLVIADVVKESGLEKAYVYQIFDGKKKNPSREKMIAIAFGMHLDEDETQRMLKLAGHSELYPRVARDAVILFAIQRGMSIWDTDRTLAENDLPTILPE